MTDNDGAIVSWAHAITPLEMIGWAVLPLGSNDV